MDRSAARKTLHRHSEPYNRGRLTCTVSTRRDRVANAAVMAAIWLHQKSPLSGDYTKDALPLSRA